MPYIPPWGIKCNRLTFDRLTQPVVVLPWYKKGSSYIFPIIFPFRVISDWWRSSLICVEYYTQVRVPFNHKIWCIVKSCVYTPYLSAINCQNFNKITIIVSDSKYFPRISICECQGPKKPGIRDCSLSKGGILAIMALGVIEWRRTKAMGSMMGLLPWGTVWACFPDPCLQLYPLIFFPLEQPSF